MTLGPAVLDHDILALDKAHRGQAAPEFAEKFCIAGRRGAVEKADDRRRRLLRTCRERPRRRRTANKGDELASPHRRPRGSDNRS